MSWHAHQARGGAALTTVLYAPARNYQNIEDIFAYQPAKTRETPYCIHMLPLLNRHSWKQLVFKNVSKYMPDVLCNVSKGVV
jgi:hypothetical protein